jgi:hypothetical protein
MPDQEPTSLGSKIGQILADDLDAALPDPNDSPTNKPPLQFPSKPVAQPPFNISPVVYKEVAQSLLVASQNARSIENGVTAFLPLASDDVRDTLLRIQGHAEQIHKLTTELYSQIAVTAFNN